MAPQDRKAESLVVSLSDPSLGLSPGRFLQPNWSSVDIGVLKNWVNNASATGWMGVRVNVRARRPKGKLPPPMSPMWADTSFKHSDQKTLTGYPAVGTLVDY